MIQATVGATQDAYVIREQPNTNTGSQAVLDLWLGRVSPDWHVRDRREVLVQFDLSSIPSPRYVFRATLNLWCSSLADNGAFRPDIAIDRVTGPWTQAGVTWNNRPGATGLDGVAV